MSVPAILDAIDRDARQEADDLLAAAAARAAELVERADAAADARIESACARATLEIRAESVRRVNEARLRFLERRAAAASGRIEAAFEAAADQVESIAAGGDAERWRRSLAGLAEEALALTGPGAELRVRSVDAGAVADAAARHGAQVRPHPDDAMPPGLVARSADGVLEVDATLPARLARARTDLIEVVARALADDEAGDTGALGDAGAPGDAQ